MTGALWGIALLGLGIAVLAARWALQLRKDLNHLKREHYYTTSRLKRTPEEIRAVVQPLRLHVAKLAAGGTVKPELILDGRLYQDVTAAEAQEVLERDGGQQPERILFVDVRTAKEYATRRVPGAKLVPFDDLDTRYKDDIPDTAEKVFIYCMAGERSRMACDFLSLKGYTNLYNISDGLRGWRGSIEGEGEIQVIQIERKQATPAH